MCVILLVGHVNTLIDKSDVYIVLKVRYQMTVLRYVRIIIYLISLLQRWGNRFVVGYTWFCYMYYFSGILVHLAFYFT